MTRLLERAANIVHSGEIFFALRDYMCRFRTPACPQGSQEENETQDEALREIKKAERKDKGLSKGSSQECSDAPVKPHREDMNKQSLPPSWGACGRAGERSHLICASGILGAGLLLKSADAQTQAQPIPPPRL